MKINWKKKAQAAEAELSSWQQSNQNDRNHFRDQIALREKAITERENQLRETLQAVGLYMMARAQLAITLGNVQSTLSKGSDVPKVAP